MFKASADIVVDPAFVPETIGREMDDRMNPADILCEPASGSTEVGGDQPWAIYEPEPAPPLIGNYASFVAAWAARPTVKSILLVVGPGDDQHVRSVAWLMAAADRRILRTRAGDTPTTTQDKFDLVIVDPSLAASDLLVWLAALPRLTVAGGAMIGSSLPGPNQVNEIVATAIEHGLSVQLGDSFWFASSGLTVAPDGYAAGISGGIAPIHFASMAEELGVVTNREAFLQVTGAGISCQFREGGGYIFENKIPDNFSSPEEMLQKISFVGGFRNQEISEGRTLSFVRNVTMSGRLGLLYSSTNGVYDETFITGRCYAPVFRRLIHEHDHFMRMCRFSLDDASMPHLGSMFASSEHRIDQPVVMINSWDLWCYNHWINYTLSRFWYLDAFPELGKLPIVIGPIARKFQYEFLAMLGLSDATFIQQHQTAKLRLARAYHPSLAEAPQQSAGNAAWLRSRFLDKAAAVPAGLEAGLYYISRGDAGRGIINEEEILDLIGPYGFKKIDFGRFSVAEQIALMRNAKVVIGPHGSSMANIVFISEGCRVLDLAATTEAIAKQKHGAMGPEISFAASRLGAKYFVLNADRRRDLNDLQSGFGYNMDEFKALFHELMSN